MLGSLTDVDTEDGYCSPNQFILEYVSTSGDEDPPVRWRAPECLTKNRYSTASDVWAFGVLMYEVLTFGRIPYEHVLNDDALYIRVRSCCSYCEILGKDYIKTMF